MRRQLNVIIIINMRHNEHELWHVNSRATFGDFNSLKFDTIEKGKMYIPLNFGD